MSDDIFFEIEHLEYKHVMNMSEMHSHDNFEIYYQMSGGRNYFIEDRFYSTKKGDVLIIAPGTRHKTTYAGIKNYQRFCIYFRPEFLTGFDRFASAVKLLGGINGYSIVELKNNEREKVEFLLFNMLEEFNTRPGNYALNLELMLKELIIYLDRSHCSVETGKSYSPNIYRLISEVCLYLQDNYSQDIKLEDLAGHFKLSAFYLSRRFKEITNHSIPQYMNNIRLEVSRDLLKSTNHTVTEIATHVGYASPSHFARVFKKYLGLSPHQYRKKHEKTH